MVSFAISIGLLAPRSLLQIQRDGRELQPSTALPETNYYLIRYVPRAGCDSLSYIEI